MDKIVVDTVVKLQGLAGLPAFATHASTERVRAESAVALLKDCLDDAVDRARAGSA
jgi:methionine aminopeptidase